MRRTQTRNSAAFLIQHDRGTGREHRAQLRDQETELWGIGDIAGEQDDPGGRVGAEQRRFFRGQLPTRDPDDRRAFGCRGGDQGLTDDQPVMTLQPLPLTRTRSQNERALATSLKPVVRMRHMTFPSRSDFAKVG